ncbi:hypothetical protein MAH1_01430 [Sessilibacter sp. MAH1]
MNYSQYLFYGLMLFSVLSCSSESSDNAASISVNNEALIESKQRARTEYLAYEHSVSVELREEGIEDVFNEIISFCSEDEKNKCTILHSSLNTGDYSYGNIRIRILPEGVNPLLGVASKNGNVSSRVTDVEDLQDSIVDGDKRLEMLRQYQARLIELEKKSGNDIESLIKVTQELSQVQSDIEYAVGEKAKLLQRTQMDIVHISLQTLSYVSFLRPISDSLSEFGENFSEGISQAIIALAYLLPWIVIILPLLYFVRVIWRKTRAK